LVFIAAAAFSVFIVLNFVADVSITHGSVLVSLLGLLFGFFLLFVRRNSAEDLGFARRNLNLSFAVAVDHDEDLSGFFGVGGFLGAVRLVLALLVGVGAGSGLGFGAGLGLGFGSGACRLQINRFQRRAHGRCARWFVFLVCR
jgi:hypothetical protein